MSIGMIRTKEDIEDIIRGLTLMGTGGGGRPDMGFDYLLPHIEQGKEIALTPPEAIPDECWTCSVFGMGSIAPQKTLTEAERKALGYGDWVVAKPMVEAIRELESYTGRKIEAVVPFELGAGNTTAPIDAAVRLGIKVVDGDYAGRAIPELAQTTPAMEGVPFEPGTVCNPWGDVLIMKRTASLAVAERIGKMISIATKVPDIKAPCAHAGFMLHGRDMKKLVVPGGASRSLEIGRRIREAVNGRQDPAEAAAVAMHGWVLFKGKVSSKEWQSREGYMYGTTRIQGEGPDRGRTMKIWFQNENHITHIDDQPFVTSPDLITVMDSKTGEPYTNTMVEKGLNIAVLGAKGEERYRTAPGLAILGPRHFGYKMDYVPIEEHLDIK